MKFSLIMCTVNRVNEVEKFLQSISVQTYREFELIIVDQNDDNVLEKIINEFTGNIDLIHIKSSEKGLSKNRNVGLEYATGDIIAFPDDDCVYPRHTLEKVVEIFVRRSASSITIQFTELINPWDNKQMEINDINDTIVNQRIRPINKYNCLRNTCSITIFLMKKLHDKLGGFDENIGLGAKVIQAGEDHDYVFRILKNGFDMLYIPQIAVLHPVPSINLMNKNEYTKNKNRVEMTGKVNMYMANKHKLGLDFKLYRLIDRMFGFVFRLIKLDMKRCKLIYCDIKAMIKYWNLN